MPKSGPYVQTAEIPTQKGTVPDRDNRALDPIFGARKRGGAIRIAPPLRSGWSFLVGVFKLRIPAGGAVRKQVEQVPGAAVEIAGTEVVFGHARYAAVVVLAEY